MPILPVIALLGSTEVFSTSFEGTTLKVAAWEFVDKMSAINGTVCSLSGKAPKGNYIRLTGPMTFTVRGAGVPEAVAAFSDPGTASVTGKRGSASKGTVSKNITMTLYKPTIETVTVPNFTYEKKAPFRWIWPTKPITFKAGGLTFTSLKPMSSHANKWTMQFDVSGAKASEVFLDGAFKTLNAGEPGANGAWKRILVEVPASVKNGTSYGGKVTVIVGKSIKTSKVKAEVAPKKLTTCPHGANAWDVQFSSIYPALPEELKLLK